MISVKRNYPVIVFLTLSLLHSCGDGQPKTLPQSAFQVEFGKSGVPSEMLAGETVVAEILFGNAGNQVWPSTADTRGRKQVNLSYHWLDADRKVVIFDGLRTHLPHDLQPGETLRINASIQAPPHAGKYVLQLSMVQEAVAWFHDKGGVTLDLPVRVVEVAVPVPTAKPKRVAGASSASGLSDSKSTTAKKTRR